SLGLVIAQLGPGNPPDAAFAGRFGALLLLYTVAIVLAWVVSTAPFVFVFSLIVDRHLSGPEALWTTFKAMLGNFWGLLGLLCLDGLLYTVGLFLGCVGWYFVVPLILAADVVAYRQVFPRVVPHEEEWDETEPDLPARPVPAVGAPSVGAPSVGTPSTE